MRAAGLVLAPLAVGACSPSEDASGPGGVTTGEARALDEAAAMLDERRPAETAGGEPSAAAR
ncbi:hypothetical protein [Novosphingobium soli]|uniref:Uncharacterized protein n=1 Tax=Novosphingobium soli TaxID=574956 RepID=A0ABV6CS28_9SPHN